MSEIYASDRELSHKKFYSNALDIFVEVDNIVHSEKIIPKSKRLTHALPLLDMARSAIYNIKRAYKFYPNTPANVRERRKYLTLAIADVDELATEFGLLPRCRMTINMNKFEDVTNMIEEEIALLKGARNNVRLIGKQSIAQRIAGLEDQIAELRELLSEEATSC